LTPTAEVQRAMGFQNEKDHPEVAPSQFEINYGYGEVVSAADQIQLYSDLPPGGHQHGLSPLASCRSPWWASTAAACTPTFPSARTVKTSFGTPRGEEKLSKFGWDFVDRILTHGNDICLLFNSSVNAYRRLDPHFEAPNQLNASAVNRGAMVRIPLATSAACAPKCARRS